MEKVHKFDILILGGGPAGLSAAIYCARGNFSTAILDINPLGGQPSNYSTIENYPGFPEINGFELMEKFEQQADKFGIKKYSMLEILEVDIASEVKTVLTTEGTFIANAIILATGAHPKKLGISGEAEFIGRGVSYCAVCDGAFFKNKTVSVVGGGNSAIEEAIYLSNFAQQVFIIHRRNKLRADNILQNRLKTYNNIKIIYNSIVSEIKGNSNVESIDVYNLNTNEHTELKTDGVFPYIGLSPNSELFSGQVEQDTKGFIKTDEQMQTTTRGVFAAGDVRNTPLRQVVTAASDGAVSAISAIKYLESIKSKIQTSVQM